MHKVVHLIGALRENLGDASFYGDFDICGLRVHSFA